MKHFFTKYYERIIIPGEFAHHALCNNPSQKMLQNVTTAILKIGWVIRVCEVLSRRGGFSKENATISNVYSSFDQIITADDPFDRKVSLLGAGTEFAART